MNTEAKKMKAVTLTGALTWFSTERRTDRYGGIMLCHKVVDVNAGGDSATINMNALLPFIGKRVHITAKVLVSKKSCHMGDHFRNIGPSKTPVGEVLDLGIGRLCDLEYVTGRDQSIIFCRDGRERLNDWMDPHILYRLHDHVVKLTITDASAEPFVMPDQGEKRGIKDGSITFVVPENDGDGYVQTKDTYDSEELSD
jgi:hypothetical protein